ncbi:Alpha/beta knot methyltransferase [Tribonema minus]|uniref:Alpha/beta knot methyltransferase n=1 Tax=Tribonema minus TaxID=303371 RepID=A0A836CMU2_9STRA|nr:Alpha/beta knot methyltransferase [Tribonema minus]
MKDDEHVQLPKTLEEKCEGRRVVVVLWRASLETVKTRRGEFQLLNCDDHKSLITKKSGKDPADLRPDIVHQELLALLDSPLNKAGRLQVYVHTGKGVLVEVSPQTRIPRTFKRFSGLMVQLLHKLKIRAANSNATLLRVVKNPVTRHLPAGARIYGMSVVGTLYNPRLFAAQLPEDVPIVLYVGAMAQGHLTIADHPEVEEMISVSEYPLSGAAAIARVLGAIESEWGIV